MNVGYIQGNRKRQTYERRERESEEKSTREDKFAVALSFDHREIAPCRAMPLAICILLHTH